ncbi:MAG: DNA-directed DNA polymerase I [Nitrososphaerota archaeon]|nr:DNA-directed DNA polymerase I [Nitrososphaerota archaeon]
MSAQSYVNPVTLRAKLADLTKPASEIGESLLASATYDGDKRKAVLKFYDQRAGRFWLWEDNTGHRPYCFTRLPMEELGEVSKRKDVIEIVEEEKLDLLNDTRTTLRKIVTTDPLAIGGGNDSIRDQIRAWEADIKYYENFAYDRGLKMGTYYKVSQGKVIPVGHEMPERVGHSLDEILRTSVAEFKPYLSEWARLLSEPLANFRRIALDIEVDNEAGRLPDVENPVREVIAVSFFNEEEKVVYLLKGKRAVGDFGNHSFAYEIFEKEEDLLRAVLSKVMDYPVVLTFNGDDFDLRYLQHRAEKVGIREDEDPIQLERVAASLKHGIHIDLYQFFRNRSIQVYAFNNRYTEHTLGGVAEVLLGKSKIEFEGEIGDLPLSKLAEYCLNDSQLTYEFTSMSDSLVMKLLLMISRIGKMPMNDVSRLGISNWIRSMLFYEHRRVGALIPRQDELAEKGGASSKAIIKGKKYKGGLVIDPKPGVYFDVSVLDFASLYPSLMKVHNLSYETVNCPHPECRVNRIPDTDSWECTKKKGITSLVIGSLRDLRVGHYKHLARDPTLSKQDRELYGVVSQSLKVYLNGSYGSFGFESFAFYCLPVAEATAALGRDAITRTIAKCNELGINVLYSDTDSVYLQNPSKEQIATVTRWADSDLGVELDLDKVYRYVAFSSRKKNYFGVFPDGTVDIKGLTGKKSVDGLTPILARVDGRQKLTTVAETYREFHLGKKVEVVSVTDHLTSVWVPISDAMKHQVDDVYEVSTGKGRVLRLSGDHSVYMMDNFGNLRTRETRKMTQGDVLVGARFVPPPTEPLTLNVAEYLTSPSVARGNLLFPARAHSTAGTPMPRHVAVTEDLGRLLGIYVAEGSSSSKSEQRNDVIIQDSTVNKEVCKAVLESWKAVFGWDMRVISTESRAKSFYLPTLYNEFFRRVCGSDSDSKRVPEFIFGCERQVVRAFLQGYFSGDGYSNSRRINAASRNRELLVQVAHLLSYFDIDCRIRRQYNRKYRRHYHVLSVVGTSSRLRFLTDVGFLQARFRSAPATMPRNKELLPLRTNGLISVEHAILSRVGKKNIRNLNFHDERSYDVMLLQSYKDTVSRLWRLADQPEKRELAKIYRMISSQDVTYDEVVEVKRVSGPRKMYDFSVPGLERFVAGDLPTLLHNSQTPEYLKRRFYETLEVLSSVKTPEDFERARASTRELLTKMVSDLKGKKVPVSDLAFTVMMGKPTAKYNGTTPQHVRAAMQLEEKGKEIKAGEIIAYVKTKSPPYVKPAELARAEEVDADKYIEYAHSMFDQLLDALDFSFDEIMGATTLDLFWGS